MPVQCPAHEWTSINAQIYYRSVPPHPQMLTGLGLEFDME